MWTVRGGALAVAALAYLGAPSVAFAQAQAAPSAPSQNTTYGPDFFAGYAVNNAEDMLRVIPGVQAILNEQNGNDQPGQQQRGFGSGGTRVLLNGRRFPGKSNEIGGNLRRISAETVERVELISGQTEGITVNSQGILVNIVLREGASLAGAGNYEITAKLQSEDARSDVDGLISYKGARGALSYSLGVEFNSWPPANLVTFQWGDKSRDETFFYADGTVMESRFQDHTRFQGKWIYNAGVTYDFSGGSRLELNGYREVRGSKQLNNTDFTRYSPAGAVTLAGLDFSESRVSDPTKVYELGGEYAGDLAGGSLQILAIARGEHRVSKDFRQLVTPGRIQELNRTVNDQNNTEEIGRAVYNFGLRPGQSMEVGAEVARNGLDADLLAFFDVNGDGVLDPTPNQLGKVQEKRAEIFATHRWTMSPALSLESTLNWEFSAITSNFRIGDVRRQTPKRELNFPKPRFDLRYRTSPQQQLRLRVERTISQLQFGNFVPGLNFENNVLVEGNPFLEPEKTWIVEPGYERRLPNDAGLLEARAFYNDITDAIDRAPVVLPSGAVGAVQGNIPSAYVYGAEVKVSVRLGFIRLPSSLLSLRYLAQKSKVRDPFTSEYRRLTSDRHYQFDVSYRQDLRGLGASWGFSYKDTGDSIYSTDLIGPNLLEQYYAIEPTLEAFVEKSLPGAKTLRIEVQNLSKIDERRARFYSRFGTPNAPTLRYETFTEDREIRAAVRLRGSF